MNQPSPLGMERYHVIGTISFEGAIFDYCRETVPARITPRLSQALELIEFGGLLHRIREPELSVTRWI